MSLRLTVRNEGDEPAELTFRSGQTAEFVARDETGVAWRWSDDRAFTQQIRTETLAPGEELDAEGRWPDPEPRTYTVTATLTATDHRPTATATVEV